MNINSWRQWVDRAIPVMLRIVWLSEVYGNNRNGIKEKLLMIEPQCH
jgi:hypothetical protein